MIRRISIRRIRIIIVTIYTGSKNNNSNTLVINSYIIIKDNDNDNDDENNVQNKDNKKYLKKYFKK